MWKSEEYFVSFDTAKALLEKGFDGMTSHCYGIVRTFNGKTIDLDTEIELKEEGFGKKIKTEWRVCNIFWMPNYLDNTFPCPTIEDVRQWLREERNLIVNPVLHKTMESDGKEQWEADIYYRDSGIDATINACGHIYGDTYEEACENGIIYCLLYDIIEKK